MGDKLPPVAQEAEQKVIGCVLADPAHCLPILQREGIGRRHFFDQRLAGILVVVGDLYYGGVQTPEDGLILPRLKSAGVKCDYNFLFSLRDNIESVYNLEYWLPPLKEASQRRNIIQFARDAIKVAQNGADLDQLNDTADQFTRLIRHSCESDDLPSIVQASEFMANDLPDAPEAIGGILYKGSKLVLSGASKAGKTWLFIDLGTAVACGLEWLGIPTAKGRVLYLNTELSERSFQKRLGYICRAKGISGADLGNLDLWHLRGKTSPWNVIIPKIRTRVKTAGYQVIIIDPLYRLYGSLKENSAEDMGVLTNALGELAEESGAALAIATHHSKGNQAAKEAIDRISGSGVIARDADALIDFTANEVEDAFSVSLRLRDFKPMDDFGVSWRFPLFYRDANIDPAKIKTAAGRKSQFEPVALLSVIAGRTSENPISISEWSALAEIKRKTLSDYCEKLRLKGWIQTIGEGAKARQFITRKGIELLEKSEAA